MNLNKLFEIQAGLDYHIVKEKGLEGQGLLDKKILALQVELGELANEQRTWKFWSHDQRPRGQGTYLEYRPVDQGGNHWVTKNPLLEEYVDCLHFILSIGLDKKYTTGITVDLEEMRYEDTITKQFSEVFYYITELGSMQGYEEYLDLVESFAVLGDCLGFTWEQIEQAYLAKNQINHERQLNGY